MRQRRLDEPVDAGRSSQHTHSLPYSHTHPFPSLPPPFPSQYTSLLYLTSSSRGVRTRIPCTTSPFSALLPCASLALLPTHIPCLLLSRALPPFALFPVASQHTHPLPYSHTHPLPCSHTHPLPTFSSHALFLPWLPNTHIPSLLDLSHELLHERPNTHIPCTTSLFLVLLLPWPSLA